MNFDTTLIRCHKLGVIMTNDRSGKQMGETCKTYLKQLYREKKYNRRKEITSKYIEKGLNVEEDAITLYSRVKHKMFKKNEERIPNEFISGEPDIYEGESIHNASHIIDTKAAWDLFTLPYTDDNIDKGYFYQLQGYMDLTGATKATLVYCLINTPDFLIEKEIKNIFWKTGIEADEKTQVEIYRQMRFDDIHMNERIVEFSFERDDKVIEAIHERVIECREFLNSLK